MTRNRANSISFKHFQIATGYICEGNNVAAIARLNAAIRAIDRATNPDTSLRADLCDLVQKLEGKTMVAA